MKIIIGISGASGSIYAKILIAHLTQIQNQISQCSMVFTQNASKIWQHELGEEAIIPHWIRVYDNHDFYAPFASGSAQYDLMIICPCSVGMLGRICSGIASDLMSRAADVILKERKKLICVLREMPYNLIHIENMKTLTMAGGIICPANPTFYHRPSNIEELASTVVERIIDLSGLKFASKRWAEDISE